MLNAVSPSWLIGGWITSLAVIISISVAMGANLSTTLLLLGLGVAPGVVIALLTNAAPAPTVAEILHSVQTQGGRS